MNLTNQELLQELDQRIKAGTIKIKNDLKVDSNSLLTSLLDSKTFLIAALVVVICLASVQMTSLKGSIDLSDDILS